jgi:hypothetical protein
MRNGIFLPPSGEFATPRRVAALAASAEDEAAHAMAEAGVTWLLAGIGRQPAADVEAEVRAGTPDSSGRLGR